MKSVHRHRPLLIVMLCAAFACVAAFIITYFLVPPPSSGSRTAETLRLVSPVWGPVITIAFIIATWLTTWRALRLSLLGSLEQSYHRLNTAAMEIPALASALGQSQADSFFHGILVHFETAFRLHKEGVLLDDEWESELKFMSRVCMNPRVESAYNSTLFEFVADFRPVIAHAIQEGKAARSRLSGPAWEMVPHVGHLAAATAALTLIVRTGTPFARPVKLKVSGGTLVSVLEPYATILPPDALMVDAHPLPIFSLSLGLSTTKGTDVLLELYSNGSLQASLRLPVK